VSLPFADVYGICYELAVLKSLDTAIGVSHFLMIGVELSLFSADPGSLRVTHVLKFWRTTLVPLHFGSGFTVCWVTKPCRGILCKITLDTGAFPPARVRLDLVCSVPISFRA
jgi:hypothetical protein